MKEQHTSTVLTAAIVVMACVGIAWGTDAKVAFSVCFAVLIAAACCFVAGISTPKSPAATHLRTG